MVNNLKNKLFEQGYLKVKNVLNFQRDLKPILNDMEFVMDCLIQKFAKKKNVKKVLNLDFKKKYSYISKLKIDDLGERRFISDDRLKSPRAQHKRSGAGMNVRVLDRRA